MTKNDLIFDILNDAEFSSAVSSLESQDSVEQRVQEELSEALDRTAEAFVRGMHVLESAALDDEELDMPSVAELAERLAGPSDEQRPMDAAGLLEAQMSQYYLRARGLLERGENAAACDAFAALICLAPDLPFLWRGHADALRQQQYFNEALASYEAALEIDPQDIHNYAAFADFLLAEDGELSAVEDLAERAEAQMELVQDEQVRAELEVLSQALRRLTDQGGS